MSKYDLSAARKSAEREGYLGGSDIFKVKEGANRVRVVSDALPHPGEFKGKPNFKWLVYVLDRADGAVKPYFMPHRIFKILEDLQTDEEYGFEGMPMPFDVVINAKGAGTIDVEYGVVPRKATPLTSQEINAIDAAKPLADLQRAIREKSDKPAPTSFDPEEIPV